MRMFINGYGHLRLITMLFVIGLFSVGAIGSASAADLDLTDEELTFALITHAQPGDTFWDIVRKGAAVAADKHDAELIYLHGKSPAKQAAKLRNVITQGVDGIALTLAFPEAMRPLVKKAKEAGIPVIGVNSGFDAWKSMPGVVMYVGQDETLAGEAVGRRLNKMSADKVVCVNQQQGAVQLAARCHGVANTFKGDMETLFLEGYDMSVARSRMMAKLMADPKIDVIVTLGAPFAPVAVEAVEMANSDAKVVTFDLNPRAAELIKAGKIEWAIDQQPFLQGYEAIDLLWLYNVNGDVLGGGKAVLTGPSFVGPKNIDQIMKYVQRGTR